MLNLYFECIYQDFFSPWPETSLEYLLGISLWEWLSVSYLLEKVCLDCVYIY